MNIKYLILLTASLFAKPALGMWAAAGLAESDTYKKWRDGQLAQGEAIRQAREEAAIGKGQTPVAYDWPEESIKRCLRKCWAIVTFRSCRQQSGAYQSVEESESHRD